LNTCPLLLTSSSLEVAASADIIAIILSFLFTSSWILLSGLGGNAMCPFLVDTTNLASPVGSLGTLASPYPTPQYLAVVLLPASWVSSFWL